ncbi:hypothetical protein F5887DRAFT_960890, partial [Amanita rubescens]
MTLPHRPLLARHSFQVLGASIARIGDRLCHVNLLFCLLLAVQHPRPPPPGCCCQYRPPKSKPARVNRRGNKPSKRNSKSSSDGAANGMNKTLSEKAVIHFGRTVQRRTSAATAAGGLGILAVSAIPAMCRLHLLSAEPQQDACSLSFPSGSIILCT